uniref:Cytochrome P450 CYP12AR1 n=2 Tax=Chrysoperla zastrowi sillemi TaxID=482137 RepID=A0A9E7YCH0_9NEOP|nr:cytochrome P450 CYP12AR1 [Chrysoperla zastrowi sillemi]
MNKKLVSFHEIPFKFQQLRNLTVDKNINNKLTTENKKYHDLEWNEALPFEFLPGPKPLPIIGNAWRFFPFIGNYYGKNILELHKQLHKEYGNIVILKGIMGRPPFVITFSPEDCEKIFRNEGTRPYRNGIGSLAYYQKVVRKNIYKNNASLAVLQGDEWHKMRAQVNSALMQPRVVARYVNRIENVARDFILKIDFLLKNSKNTDELPDDFLNEIYRWSLETAGEISLDTRLGCLELNVSQNSEVQQIIDAVNDMFDLIFELNILPSMWRQISTPKYKKFVRTMDYLTSICRKYADRAQTKMLGSEHNNDTVPSVLEVLLKVDKVVAIIMAVDILLAGVDTTGKTAAAVMYFLSINQEKQDKLREELIELMPDPNTPLTRQILDKMTYLRGCIKEAQRIASITPGQNRVLPKDITLSGYQIPKNTEVFTGNLLMCNLDENYPKSNQYIPERWLRNSAPELTAKTPHPFVFLPFGHGPRACIGRRFAFCELEVLIATVFRKYKFEWHHDEMKFNSRLFYGVDSPLKFKLIPIY